MKKVNNYKRFTLNQLGGEVCAYCGKWADTRDHVIPLSKARLVKVVGSLHPGMVYRILNSKSNLVPCCQPCNNEKGDMMPADWFALHPEYVKQFKVGGRYLSNGVKAATGLWAGNG